MHSEFVLRSFFVTNKEIKIRYNENNGNYEIIHNGFSWVSDGRKANITVHRKVTVVKILFIGKTKEK